MSDATAGLELDEDRAFQERFWSVQRVAWLVFAAFLAAALLGLTGSGGPLSRAMLDTGAGSIDYPRVARWDTEDELRIRFAGTRDGGALTFTPDFRDLFAIEGFQPAPVDEAATQDGQRVIFDLGNGAGAREVVVAVRPLRPALGARVHLRIDDGAPLALSTTVLP